MSNALDGALEPNHSGIIALVHAVDVDKVKAQIPEATKVTTAEVDEATAKDITEAASAWLGERLATASARPFCLWVHYVEPHAPYRFQEDFAAPLGDLAAGVRTRRRAGGGAALIVLFAASAAELERRFPAALRTLSATAVTITCSPTWNIPSGMNVAERVVPS